MLNTTLATFGEISTTDTATAAAVGATVGTIFGFILIFGIIFAILSIIAYWKIFEKAGEKGWKILIPFYNLYIMYKIVNMKNWFWTIFFMGCATSIVMAFDGTANLSTMSEAELSAFDWSAHPSTIAMLVVELILGIWSGILFAWRNAKVFGHGIGYTIGLLFFPNIFWLIIAFSNDKYDKKRLKKSTSHSTKTKK